MNYIAVLFIIGMLILIHELGHFLAARAVGIRIEIFSVGFGPALWKKRSGDTEYRFSLVPLGGYVLPAVADENDYFRIPDIQEDHLLAGRPHRQPGAHPPAHGPLQRIELRVYPRRRFHRAVPADGDHSSSRS